MELGKLSIVFMKRRYKLVNYTSIKLRNVDIFLVFFLLSCLPLFKPLRSPDFSSLVLSVSGHSDGQVRPRKAEMPRGRYIVAVNDFFDSLPIANEAAGK